jgi:hypothetical protein
MPMMVHPLSSQKLSAEDQCQINVRSISQSGTTPFNTHCLLSLHQIRICLGILGHEANVPGLGFRDYICYTPTCRVALQKNQRDQRDSSTPYCHQTLSILHVAHNLKMPRKAAARATHKHTWIFSIVSKTQTCKRRSSEVLVCSLGSAIDSRSVGTSAAISGFLITLPTCQFLRSH